jgi:Domain of unknown function (DUF397)
VPVRDDKGYGGGAEASHISSYSGGGDCVQVTRAADGSYLVTHSTAEGAPIAFSSAEWSAFLQGVKAGEFDF